MLSRRYWLIQNIDWLMDEMIFHKENHEFFINPSFKLWDLNAVVGEMSLDEITRRPE